VTNVDERSDRDNRRVRRQMSDPHRRRSRTWHAICCAHLSCGAPVSASRSNRPATFPSSRRWSSHGCQEEGCEEEGHEEEGREEEEV